MKPIIDRVLNLAISKKLTVFAIATILMLRENIESEDWVYIAMLYISVQGLLDMFIKWKK